MADKQSEDIERAIRESKGTPCMECLEKAQIAHIACYIAAGDDAAKKAKCDKDLAAAIKSCPCPE